ncbi:MAG: toxin-antitoxin system YwqK family antitoxin [Planctomycetes bacterium]|nr:toxin-antitoxin system YwqK family antitoxin [Planctomycetota bacterium]
MIDARNWRKGVVVMALLCLQLGPLLANMGEPFQIVVEKEEEVDSKLRSIVSEKLKECPPGCKLQIVAAKLTQTYLNPPVVITIIQSIVPLDEQGRPHGQMDYYMQDRGGNPLRVVSYSHGKKNGKEQHFDHMKEGAKYIKYVQMEIPWKDDLIEGERISYYAKDLVSSKTSYVKGKASGESIRYDKVGKVESKCLMKDGYREGLFTEYWPESGEIKKTVQYKGGFIDGPVKEFYANGKLKREMSFAQDLLHGIEKEFEADGKLIRTRYWVDGDKISREEYESRQKK